MLLENKWECPVNLKQVCGGFTGQFIFAKISLVFIKIS